MRRASGAGIAAASLVALSAAAEVSLVLPRATYTAAEPIPIAVACPNETGARGVRLELRCSDGSLVAVEVPLDPRERGGQSRLVTLKPFVLKPGRYAAALGPGGRGGAEFSVHPAEHPNAYPTGQWVHGRGEPEVVLAKGGWMFMNTDYAGWTEPGGRPRAELPSAYVEARMRPYHLMILGGGHQLDLELANDWGDPWVQRAIAWRMSLAALRNRVFPVAGLHCFDEPGLTWWPVEGRGLNPFAVPHQIDEFRRLTGRLVPSGAFEEVAPSYAGMMDDWVRFLDMRMKYLEQAWHATVWGVDAVHPGFETVNQVSSSYSAGNVTDGVDGRQSRPYRVVSGHGGYSDLPFGTFQPIRSCEGFQSFSRGRPHVYLPMWYTHTWATIRNAVFASWITKLEGILYTPEQRFALDGREFGLHGTNTVFEIAETNRRLALVGGVMTQLPKSLSPVAVLWSHTQAARDIAEAASPRVTGELGAPQYASPHTEAVNSCFFRTLEAGLVPNWIDEAEAVEGGPAFLKQWKVVFCPGLSGATGEFRKALEGFVASGGRLVQFRGDRLRIKGAVEADYKIDFAARYYRTQIEPLQKEKNPEWRRRNMDLAWRRWNSELAPTSARDLAGWLGEREYASENPDVLLATHRAGRAVYILMANNAQDPENPRSLKHELAPARTRVKLPPGGRVYDLFAGGEVPARNGAAELELAAGDGAAWLHLPEPPGRMSLSVRAVGREAGPSLDVELVWGGEGYLPFRLRILEPSGAKFDELWRATTPEAGRTAFRKTFPLGANAAGGEWTVEVHEWLTGTTARASARVEPPAALAAARVETGRVSVLFDDAKRLRELFDGKAAEPPYERLNWDSRRVFGLDPRKFAVFGPAPHAERIAAALRAKGMEVEANPRWSTGKFAREPDRGGAGPVFRDENYEGIYAHAIVLDGHELLRRAADRGLVNCRPSPAFPGPGRAFVQWGMGCFQAGWHDVFVLGDLDVGTDWLVEAIGGRIAESSAEARASVAAAPVRAPERPLQRRLEVTQEIRLSDTPVGVGSCLGGEAACVLLHDGSAAAYDRASRRLWRTRVLSEGWTLAVNPSGDRVALGGYPGVAVLDARTGRVLWRRARGPESAAAGSAIFVSQVVWNSSGTLLAAGWAGSEELQERLAVMDAEGGLVSAPAEIPGQVMGVAFVPGKDILLAGADRLVASDARSGRRIWGSDIGGASSFAFSADGELVAAGGWGRTAGVFRVSDGKPTARADFPGVVGGLAFSPDGDLAVAVWGGARPLYAMRRGAAEPQVLFQSKFGFQSVSWSEPLGGLLAAEQGGRIWLLGVDGRPLARLEEDSGTTAYRMAERGGVILLGRMNRTLQRLAAR